MEGAQKNGFETGGFDAYVSTNVIAAAGVSSSASFEMLICTIIDYFFNESKMSFNDYAKVGQYAENGILGQGIRNDGSDGMCSWWSGSLRLCRQK